jgi:hypothetical protein
MRHPDTARRTARHLAWLGPVVAVAGLVSYFTVAVHYPALRDVPWVNLPMVLAGVGLSGWALFRRRSLWRVAGLLVSVAAAALLAGYVFVLSDTLPSAAGVVAVDEPAPAFALPDHTGATVRLDDFAGRDLVVVFYRGFW